MIAYLLATSIFLHFVTFFIIVLLVQKMKGSANTDQAQANERHKQEIEDLLVAYTSEMKEENEKLINKINNSRKIEQREIIENRERVVNAPNQRNVYEAIQRTNITPQKKRYSPPKAFVTEEDTYAAPKIEDTIDQIEQSSTAKVLMLAKQGYTSKEIAKKLNMGDGEVQLLLKFHK